MLKQKRNIPIHRLYNRNRNNMQTLIICDCGMACPVCGSYRDPLEYVIKYGELAREKKDLSCLYYPLYPYDHFSML